MGENTLSARPEADKQSEFHALFIWDFHGRFKRRGKSLDIINLQRIIGFDFLLKRVGFTSPQR